MATSREERLQQRMRGALRHQVQDASFDLFLPVVETADEEDPLSSDPASTTPGKSAPATTTAAPISSPSPRRRSTPGSSAKRNAPEGTVPGQPQPRSTPLGTRPGRPSSQTHEEEVDESPAGAPGSGRRRAVALREAASRAQVLQEAIVGDTNRAAGSADAPGSLWARKRTSAVETGRTSPVPSSSPPPPSQRLPKPALANSGLSQVLSSSPPPRPAATTASARPRARRASPTMGADTDAVDELSPELAAETGPGPVRPSVSPTAGKTAKTGTIFSKLATAKRLSAENADPNAEDELSSPSFAGIDLADMSAIGSLAASSSPLARKSVVGARSVRKPSQTAGANSRRSTLSSRGSRGSLLAATPAATAAGEEDPDRDELSPEQPTEAPPASLPPTRSARSATVPSSSPPLNRRPFRQQPQQETQETRPRRGKPRAKEKEPAVEEEVEEAEEAEEIDAAEAARVIGRKRPRRSDVHEPSPELGSGTSTAAGAAASEVPEPAAADADAGASTAKRPRRRHLQEQSPAAQNQPRLPKQREKQRQQQQQKQRQQQRRRGRRTQDEATHDSEAGDEDEDGGGGRRSGRGSDRGPPVPITVQRYTKGQAAAFAYPVNRSSVNAVDVLAQMCEDIIDQKLQQAYEQAQALRQAAESAEGDEGGEGAGADASARAKTREARQDVLARHRALAAFQEELRTRLLELAVAVDTLHTLRRRVRMVHKEKLALREEILRIRAEREQLALRMDALRMQHQSESNKVMTRVNLSAAMHDIDLAVEQGRAAPELTPAQQKTADLANLELVVSRIAEQMSGGGGTLRQIADFNAFLERTATVLEGR